MASPSFYEFTAYHMKCINFFKWTSLGRSIIRLNPSVGYKVQPSPILSQLVYFVYFVNTLAKQIFLCFLITGHIGPMEFLDTICGADYFLCGVMVWISYIIWQRYPLYEIIYRLWEVENRIYHRLGRPREIKWEAEERHGITLWSHSILTCIGMASVTYQFNGDPKYCVFTYSLLEADNIYLRLLFGFHEALFLSHAWFAMSCGNGACSFEAVNLQLLIKRMAKTVDELAADSMVVHRENYRMDDGNGGHTNERDDGATAFRFSNDGKSTESESVEVLDGNMHPATPHRLCRSSKRKKVPSAISKSYDLRKILYDYQKLMLITEEFNAWIGYKIVALSICGFCQYISSTTMAFQVLKLPGTGVGDIWFYIQDCTVAVYVTFRVFNFMSIVLPESENFLSSVRKYLGTKGVPNGYTRKFIRTLKPVSLKVGPTPLGRTAVLETMEMLASYYVCVALW